MRACPHCLSVYSVDAGHCSVDGQKLGGPQILRGRVVDEYVFEELLGLGATGCVYLGHRKGDEIPCAIKLLFREMAADESLTERFRREAEAVGAMDHPNVVKILGHGTTPAGTVFLAMEFLEGKTLKEVLEQEAPLGAVRAGRIAEQMASGLGEAHRLGFVHRDLKPGNIMLVPDEFGRDQVKLLDFGIVASLKERESDQRLTKTGYIVGTPTYMAPEQIDPKAVGPQVDVYAMGVMIYEMLSGHPPFHGTLEQILVAKMTHDPEPIDGGGELGELALRFLEKDPEKRPQTALQVSAQLGRLSLLSEDPATVRAGVPDLPSYDDVGAAPPTVRVEDEGWGTERTLPSSQTGDDWSADTRRINFESPPPIDFTHPTMVADTEEAVVARPDTLIDGIPGSMHPGAKQIVPPLQPPGEPVVITRKTRNHSNEIPTEISPAPDEPLDRDTDEDMPKPSVSISDTDPTTVAGDSDDDGDSDDRGLDAPTEADEPASPPPPADMFDRFRGESDAGAGDEETALEFIADPASNPPLPSIEEPEPDEERSSPIRIIALSVILLALMVIAAVLAFDFFTTETVLIDVPNQ